MHLLNALNHINADAFDGDASCFESAGMQRQRNVSTNEPVKTTNIILDIGNGDATA